MTIYLEALLPYYPIMMDSIHLNYKPKWPIPCLRCFCVIYLIKETRKGIGEMDIHQGQPVIKPGNVFLSKSWNWFGGRIRKSLECLLGRALGCWKLSGPACFSVAVIKTMAKSDSVGKGFSWQAAVHQQGKPWLDLKVGIWRQKYKQEVWGLVACYSWFAQLAFLCNPRTPNQR